MGISFRGRPVAPTSATRLSGTRVRYSRPRARELTHGERPAGERRGAPENGGCRGAYGRPGAGDGIRSAVETLADAVGRHPDFLFRLALLELRVYRRRADGLRIVIPSVLART